MQQHGVRAQNAAKGGEEQLLKGFAIENPPFSTPCAGLSASLKVVLEAHTYRVKLIIEIHRYTSFYRHYKLLMALKQLSMAIFNT